MAASETKTPQHGCHRPSDSPLAEALLWVWDAPKLVVLYKSQAIPTEEGLLNEQHIRGSSHPDPDIHAEKM